LGQLESLALPYQSYKLSLTPGLRDFIFGDKVTDDLLLNEGKYVHFNDGNYWNVSGTQTFDAAHFYQVTEMTDPFGFKAQIVYDSAYRFFIQQTIDALGNTSKVTGFNFRTLSPYLFQDLNDNRSGVRMDELGMVVSSFIMGKENENKGDLLDTASVEASANDQPTGTLEYDLFNYINNGKPNVIKTTVRETHYFDSVATGQRVIWQTGYGYTDGSGQILMHKVQAEPGIALQENADGTVTEVDTTPNLRWIGNGRTILNNKGKPVKQYEPYFSTTFEFEDARQLVERGVTPVITYDSAGRAIRTDLPDGTFVTEEFDAWMQKTFDQNDNVLNSQWYKDRITAPIPAVATPEEIDAANKAAAHANTPGVVYMDSLGRSFLSINDNGAAGKYKTITETDIEGNLRKVTDARGNAVMQYKYDILGASLYHNSMDAGERWVVNDVMGKPMRSWDSRNHQFRFEYDSLHRPVKSFVQTGSNAEITFEKAIYGEGITNDKQLNLRGKAYQQLDAAGIVTHMASDFKGNPVQLSRQLCSDYKNDIDWNGNPALDKTIFITTTIFDALNRPVTIISPDQSIITHAYNEAGLLNTVDVQLKGVTQKTNFVADINYDAKGQRQNIVYGNNTATSYQYDPKTFRLTQLLTTGKNGTDLLQKLQYTYDPVGDITTVKDNAQQSIFFNNTVVSPSTNYTYDALYRLISATGREHIGQNSPPSAYDASRTNLPMPGDGAAMRNYTQNYQYDAVGNILQMTHAAGNGSWTRMYTYDTASNRLLNNAIGNSTESFSYDQHGNMLTQAHLQGLIWNYRDELQHINLGGGGNVYYVYDAGGQRARKVIERQDGTKEDRIYLGDFELYHKTNNAGDVQSSTETLHIRDDARRIAMVETNTIKNGLAVTQQLIRYQYNNHLGSSSLELDDNATIISYEEYHPFGTTAYQAMNASLQAAVKRYRYTGMERDEESGLEYHSARYYLPWLGRWLSADPAGLKDGVNGYAYVKANPIKLSDENGMESKLPKEIERLLDTTQKGFSEYVSKLQKKGIRNASELGRAAAAELQKDFAKVFGADAIEQQYTFLGDVKGEKLPWSEHRIDIHLRDYNIGIELKLNPGSKRVYQARVFQETSVREGRTIAYVNQVEWEAGDFSRKKLSKNVLKELNKQVTKLEKEISKGIGNVGKAVRGGSSSARSNERAGVESRVAKEEGEASRVIGRTTRVGRIVREGKTALEVGVIGVKAVAEGAAKAVPVIGIGVLIGVGIKHLSEGRYLRAAVDFAEAIPIAGDVILAMDLLWEHLGGVMMQTPGSLIAPGPIAPFVLHGGMGGLLRNPSHLQRELNSNR